MVECLTRVQASPASLRCVLEQDTLILAYLDVKNKTEQTKHGSDGFVGCRTVFSMEFSIVVGWHLQGLKCVLLHICGQLCGDMPYPCIFVEEVVPLLGAMTN